MPLLKLIRLPNLVIVAITQLLLYYFLLRPSLLNEGIAMSLPPVEFLYFIVTTLLISAAGFIINDILDYETDMMNDPSAVIIHRKISLQASYWLYYTLNLTGFTLALCLAFFVGEIRLANIFLLASGGLYLYSRFLKKTPLLGNLLIAAYCAGVAWIVWFSHQAPLEELFQINQTEHLRIRTIFLWYIGFAFIATLFRELVKDLEDLDGDAKSGYNTLPVSLGVSGAKAVAGFCGLFLLGGVVMLLVNYAFLFYPSGTVFILTGIIIPIILALFLLLRAKNKAHYYRISQLAKWIMLAGLLLLLFTENQL